MARPERKLPHLRLADHVQTQRAAFAFASALGPLRVKGRRCRPCGRAIIDTYPAARWKFMLKLFYAPGSSSLLPHIVLHEAGLPFIAIKIDERTKVIEAVFTQPTPT
jgi:hypothetical protein